MSAEQLLPIILARLVFGDTPTRAERPPEPKAVQPGQVLDARCFQRRRDAPRVPAAYGHQQVPREGDIIWEYHKAAGRPVRGDLSRLVRSEGCRCPERRSVGAGDSLPVLGAGGLLPDGPGWGSGGLADYPGRQRRHRTSGRSGSRRCHPRDRWRADAVVRGSTPGHLVVGRVTEADDTRCQGREADRGRRRVESAVIRDPDRPIPGLGGRSNMQAEPIRLHDCEVHRTDWAGRRCNSPFPSGLVGSSITVLDPGVHAISAGAPRSKGKSMFVMELLTITRGPTPRPPMRRNGRSGCRAL